MKIKSNRFVSGHLSRVSPYEVNKSVRETLQYELIERYRYLIHLPDGRHLSGVFCKKGLESTVAVHEENGIQCPWPSSQEVEGIGDQELLNKHEAMEIDTEENLFSKCQNKQVQSLNIDGHYSKADEVAVLQDESSCYLNSQKYSDSDSNHDSSSCQATETLSSEICQLEPDSTTDDLHAPLINSSLIEQSTDDQKELTSQIPSKEFQLANHVPICPDMIHEGTSELQDASKHNEVKQSYKNLQEYCNRHLMGDIQHCLSSRHISPQNIKMPSKENAPLPFQYDAPVQHNDVAFQKSEMVLQQNNMLSQNKLLPSDDVVHSINSIVEKVDSHLPQDLSCFSLTEEMEILQLDASFSCDLQKVDETNIFNPAKTILNKQHVEDQESSLISTGNSPDNNLVKCWPTHNLDNSLISQSPEHLDVNVSQADEIWQQVEMTHLQAESSHMIMENIESSVTEPETLIDRSHDFVECSEIKVIPNEQLIADVHNSKLPFHPLIEFQQSNYSNITRNNIDEFKEISQYSSNLKPLEHHFSHLPQKNTEPSDMEESLSDDQETMKQLEIKNAHVSFKAMDSPIVCFNPFDKSCSGSPEIKKLVGLKESLDEIQDNKNIQLNLIETSVCPATSSAGVADDNSMISAINETITEPRTMHADVLFDVGNSSPKKEELLQSLLATTMTISPKIQAVSVCTVAPTAKPGNLRLLPSIASPIVQGKPPIFITPNQFKVLANICRQNSPKATALVIPNTHIKPSEEEVHVLSSDEEEGTTQPSRPIQQQSSQMTLSSSNDSSFLLYCHLRQSFFGMSKGSGILKICKLALEFFRISNVSGSIQFDIPLKEVSKMLIHHGLCGPVFFLNVSEAMRKQVQDRFSFGIGTFDPASSDLGKSFIVFVPSKKNSVERDNLGREAVTAIVENVCEHMLEKSGHRIQKSFLSGSETAKMIASVLGVPPTENIQASPSYSISQPMPPLSATACTSSEATSVTAAQVTLTTPQVTPSFVIVGGSQPINIVGSNNINITNNIININMPNKGCLTSPKTQIIVLAKKIAGPSSADKNQEPKHRSPIISLFTYPPTPGPGRMTITTEDYYCLNEGELLNDNIIDFYLKYFLDEHLDEPTKNAVHLFSSFFYGKIVSEDRMQEPCPGSSNMTPQQVRHSRVRTWTRHVDLFSKDFIIIPIIESSHWFLAVICFPGLKNAVIEPCQSTSIIGSTEERQSGVSVKQPCILIFDSLGMIGHQTVTRTLREYLQEEWNLKKKSVRGDREFTESTFPGFNPNCPQQNNSTDCGVFVLKYVESFFEKPIKDFIMPISNTADWFNQDAIREKRKEIQQLIMQLHGSNPLQNNPK